MKRLISNNLKDQILKVIWITIAWTIISLFLFSLGLSSLHQFNCDLPDYGQTSVYLIGSIVTGIVAGVVGGSTVVFLWEKWLRSISYGAAIIRIFFSYTAIYIIVSLFTGIYFQSQLGTPSYSSNTLETGGTHFLSVAQNFLFWLVTVLATLIVMQVNDKYGPGVFRSFLLGRYFHPRREERIFMFLDLRSSTAIAEKLGEKKYFNFLKDVFKDATHSILNSKGQIYQYVGDEIVISWKVDQGIEDGNCVNCFFDVQAALANRKAYYMQRYEGIVPEFKAGLHYGHVMAGEIGIVKRDIAYSGDVLSTTARIQSKCNEFGVNILLSKVLLDRMAPNLSKFHPKVIGNIVLRGKHQGVILYTM